MRFHEVHDDREADTRAGYVAAWRFGAGVEGLEDARAVRFGNTRAGVAAIDDQFAIRLPEP